MIAEAFRRFKHRRRQARALAEIAARPPGGGRPHGLARPLVLSLTSYPARFGTLAHTLQALLRQTVQPDAVILWLDPGDEDLLPTGVTDLKRDGLEIRTCPPWRAYKKSIPTLLAHPDAFVATADDDVYYPADWLEHLVAAAATGAAVACHRAHRIRLAPDGLPRPYADWEHNIAAPGTSPRLFLTGVMGALYAPGALHPDATRAEIFTALSPANDDIWMHWMHRLAGIAATKIGGRARILEWEGSQDRSLRSVNLTGGGNDPAIRAMIARYGIPWPDPHRGQDATAGPHPTPPDAVLFPGQD